MQKMKRVVRDIIIGHVEGKYNHFDLVNAHPILLRKLLQRIDQASPMLDDYISNRNARIAEVCEATRASP
jgi:hypothetical protein